MPRIVFKTFPAQSEENIFRKYEPNAAQDMTAEFIESVSFEDSKPFFFNVDGELDYGFNPSLKVEPGYLKLWISPKRLLK